jgi:uncharacterized protein YcfL
MLTYPFKYCFPHTCSERTTEKKDGNYPQIDGNKKYKTIQVDYSKYLYDEVGILSNNNLQPNISTLVGTSFFQISWIASNTFESKGTIL